MSKRFSRTASGNFSFDSSCLSQIDKAYFFSDQEAFMNAEAYPGGKGAVARHKNEVGACPHRSRGAIHKKNQ